MPHSEEEHPFRAPSPSSTVIPPAEAPPAWPEPHAAPLSVTMSIVPGDEHTATMHRAEIVGVGSGGSVRRHATTPARARQDAKRAALLDLILCVEREEGPPAAHAALALLFGSAPRAPTDLPTRPVYTPAPDPHADMHGSDDGSGGLQ